MSTNSGEPHTGWDGAFRSRLYLSSPKAEGQVPESDERILTRVKSNWAKAGETITMHWHDGSHFRVRVANNAIDVEVIPADIHADDPGAYRKVA